MRPLLCLALLVSTTSVRADVEPARDDIVDIRHGRMPSRTRTLGWTDAGAIVVRRTICTVQDLSDIPSCGVMIVVADRERTQIHGLFSATWAIECIEHGESGPDPSLGCWKISYGDASRFIAAERELRAKLGPLRAGTPIGPTLSSGTITGVRYDDERSDRRRAAIALRSVDHWRALRAIWSVENGKDEFLRRDPTIDFIERSPDAQFIAIATTLAHAEDDFYWETHGIDVVPVP